MKIVKNDYYFQNNLTVEWDRFFTPLIRKKKNIKLIYIWDVELQIYSYFLVTNAAPKFESKIASLETQGFIAFSHPHWLRLSNKF